MNQAAEQLDWLAARYVLGELDVAEAASFEERLADDESAAGAVVAAVRLVEAVVAAKPTSAVDGVLLCGDVHVKRNRGAWRWPALAVVASVAIAALPLIAMRRPVSVSEPADIVWRWQGVPMQHVVGSGMQASLESPAADRLPPWLVAAVAIAAEGASQP
jgi:anti-sigma-K factor RskA